MESGTRWAVKRQSISFESELARNLWRKLVPRFLLYHNINSTIKKIKLCENCCAPDTSGDGTGCDNMVVNALFKTQKFLTLDRDNCWSPTSLCPEKWTQWWCISSSCGATGKATRNCYCCKRVVSDKKLFHLLLYVFYCLAFDVILSSLFSNKLFFNLLLTLKYVKVKQFPNRNDSISLFVFSLYSHFDEDVLVFVRSATLLFGLFTLLTLLIIVFK